MRTLLKKHNEIAYKKVMAALETSDKTCVVHPTGTGKSYIIAAVAESFKMVLVLAPNDFILEQQKKVMAWNKGVTYRNYQWLIHNVTEITDKYDLIVLDEFHRTGADKEQRIVIEHCERTGFQPSKGSASEEVYRAWKNIIRTNPTLANEIKDKYEIFRNKKEI